jgi:hypothetical protein
MEQYIYDKAICTGLGDRVGSLMTVATLAKLHSVSIVFRWCGDPSEIYPSQHQYMPRWHGFDYNLTEFKQRFWPLILDKYIQFATPQLTSEQIASPQKIVWNGLQVPSEAGLDHVYSTAWNTVKIPGRQTLDHENYKQNYRWVSRAVTLHALKMHPHIVDSNYPYVAVHMRGPDNNTYNSFMGCHDHPRIYCTRKVLKQLFIALPGIKFFVVTNNAKWARKLISHKRLEILNETSAYDDFALLLGASAIVQHANYGWSSYSSNPSMISGAPMITTFGTHMEHHRLGWVKQFGSIPDEFYNCSQIHEFVEEVKKRIQNNG